MKPQLVVIVLAADLIFFMLLCVALWLISGGPQSALVFVPG